MMRYYCTKEVELNKDSTSIKASSQESLGVRKRAKVKHNTSISKIQENNNKSKPIGLKFFGMWSEIEELLGRKVDLVSDGTLFPFAQETADHDKILIYERTE